MKIVLNDCFGGFGVSDEFADKIGVSAHDSTTLRTHPELIAALESRELKGNEYPYAKLRVYEIPDGAHYHIFEYDGVETLVWSETELHFAN